MSTLLFDEDDDEYAASIDRQEPLGPARGELRRNLEGIASGLQSVLRKEAPDAGTASLTLAKGAAQGLAQFAVRTVDAVDDAVYAPFEFGAKALGLKDTAAYFRKLDEDRANALRFVSPRADQPGRGFVADLTEQIAPVLLTMGGAGLAGAGVRTGAALAQAAGGFIAGKATSDQLTEAGVDPVTAGIAGLQSGALAAAGIAAPASLGGPLLSRLATGAAINAGYGIGDRVATANYLRGRGYEEQAKMFEALAPEALALDLVLGAGFAALDAQGRSTDPRFREVFGRDPDPEEVDEAISIMRQHHAENLSPGLALDGRAITAHNRALERALQQAADNQPIDVQGLFEPRLRLGEDGPGDLLELAAVEQSNGQDFEAAALARLAQLRGAPIDATGPYIEAARSVSRENQQASFDVDLEARARDLDRETIAPDFMEIDRIEIDEAVQRVVNSLRDDPEFRQIINDLTGQTIDPDHQALIDLFRIQRRDGPDGQDVLLGSARKTQDLKFRVNGDWEARGYEPRDLILNFNDGLPPGESAIVLGLDPEISDVRNTIKVQESTVRTYVREYVEEGGDRLNQLAEAWRVSPEQIIDFVRNAGLRRAPSIKGHARALIRSGLTDSAKIRARLLEYADIYRLDLKPSSIKVIISQAKRKVALEASQAQGNSLLGSAKFTENKPSQSETAPDGTELGSEDRGGLGANPGGTGHPGGSGPALVERGARIRAALGEFGVGSSLVDSGYILPDGKLLKVPPGEHASVHIALDDDAQANPIGSMLEDGAIRVNSLGASLAYLPTTRQLSKLVSEWNRTYGRDYPLAIEIVDPKTQNVLVGERFSRANLERITEWISDKAPVFDENNLIASQTGFQQGSTTQTIHAATDRLKADLSRAFGLSDEAVGTLINTGRLSIFDTGMQAEAALGRSVGNVAGGYLPNSDRAFLIADRVAPDQAYRVVLHEVGVHAGIAGLLGETRWVQLQGVVRGMVPQALLEGVRFRDLVRALQQTGERDISLMENEVARLAQEHDVNPEIVRAWAEAEAFAVKGYEAEEALAYLVENAPDLPFVRRLLAQIRQWLWRVFGPDFGPRLTIDDLQELAVAALRRESRLAKRNRLAIQTQDSNAAVRSESAVFDLNQTADANFLASFANAQTPEQRAKLGQELEFRSDGERQLYVWHLNNKDFALSLTARADINETSRKAPVRVSFGELRNGEPIGIERQNFGDLVVAEQNLQFAIAGLERDIRDNQRQSYVFFARDARLERLYSRLASRLILPDSYVLARQAGVFAVIRADEVARTVGGVDGALDSAILQTTPPVEARVRTRSETDDLQAGARGDLRFQRQGQRLSDLSAAHEIARDDPELEVPLSEFGSPQPFRAREVMQLLALQRRAGDQLEPAFDVAAACALRNGLGFIDKNAPFTLIDHPRVQGLLVSQILVLAGGTPLGLMFWEALFLNGETDVPSPRIAGEREDYKNYLRKSDIQRNAGFRREEPAPNPIPSRLELEQQKASNLALVDTDQSLADLAIEAGEIVGFDGGWLEKLALKESGGDIDAQPIDPETGEPLSSAIGLTQFIDSTWIDIMKKYGSSHGFHGDLRDPDVAERALALRTNPIWSLVMAAHLAKDNAQALRNSLGRSPTQQELYLAHFAGIDEALTLIQADANDLAPIVMSRAASANPGLYYDSNGSPRTIGQVRERLAKSFASIPVQNERDG